ncbi:hypothetical protein N7508_008292 [Penicillium antarcticum]|uniref:uncharacterized protein n=1 Tax=Penicillium antarcticum TaxID=416450 RepID=UPI0023888E8A|nr:uncharacterized protein N7508_008292 [Penicillium antarcticum]KAJ5298043.1 hypothetical protein N7508_008292 [Penicillium antarcticum]
MANSSGTRSYADDPGVVVWNELQVPTGEELDTTRWAGYFHPLVQALGYRDSCWARVQGRLDIIILATLWETTSGLRNFTASPSAQLYRENLESRSITLLSSYETPYRGLANWFPSLQRSYVQLFWVYFSTPVTEAPKSSSCEAKRYSATRSRTWDPN